MNEQEPGVGWYVVAFLDVLGQSQKLSQITSVPRTSDEIAAAAPLIRDTALYVIELRKFFRSCFEKFVARTGVLDDIRQELQTAVESSTRSIRFQGFSDSFVFSLPLRERFPAIAISGTLAAASGAMCWSLSQKKPLRGGIDAGIGVNIAQGEIYGPVLNSAYRLECSAAKYPRILIGDELWKYLSLAAQDEAEADIYRKIEQRHAQHCMTWIQTDPDGLRSLDYLSVLNELDHEFWDQKVREAHSFILKQEREFLAGNKDLASRYAQLRAYFQRRVAIWSLAEDGVLPSASEESQPLQKQTRFLGFEGGSAAFNRRYPDFLSDCDPLLRFMAGINQRAAPDEHQDVVCSQLLFCWELFASIVRLVETGLPAAPVALGRNLMESVMGCIHLTDHPEKLQDFMDEAEYVILKIRKPEPGSAEEARYRQLKVRFGNQGWYCMSVAALAKATGFESAYETFYREACTITHGGALPLLIPRSGIGTRDIEATEDPTGTRDYATMALQYATLLIFSVCQYTNAKLSLGYEDDLKKFWDSCERRGWFIPTEGDPTHPPSGSNAPVAHR
ncbi:MAG: hypothetical protein HY820_44465 [Acidobacteria bacterium]|nr:hypothetical protein [Acidobacteriota bacterium]